MKRNSFLIGDSPIYGNDQILSETIRYNKDGLFDTANEKIISEARKRALDGNFSNIRIVTNFWKPKFIHWGDYSGIIDWKKVRETEKPYKLLEN